MSGATGRVAGKVALVTGAARGQGRSHATLLAAEGADVIALDLCGPVEGMAYPPSAPEDLEAVLFLASEEARFITVSTLPVDAGVNQH